MTGTIESVETMAPLRRFDCTLDFDARILRELAQTVCDLSLSGGPLEAWARTRNPADLAATPAILKGT